MDIHVQVKQLETAAQQAQTQWKQLNLVFEKNMQKRNQQRVDKLYCPFNLGHFVPRHVFAKHCWRCEQKQQGCHRIELETCSQQWFYEKAPTVTTFQREGGALVAADGTTRMELLLEYLQPDKSWNRLGKQAADLQFPAIPRHAIPSGLIRGWLINWWLLYMPMQDLILRDAVKLSRQLDQMINRDGWNAIQIYTYLLPIFHNDSSDMVYELWQFMLSLLDKEKERNQLVHQLHSTSSNLQGIKVLDTTSNNIVCIDYAHPISPVFNRTCAPSLGRLNAMYHDHARTVDIAKELHDIHDTTILQLTTTTDDTSAMTEHEKELSLLEKISQERDYKRRRRAYRAKNVHITKRSQTQIHRELINEYMQELTLSATTIEKKQ
ncbi:hypothetical protein BDF22DRAFT_732414 [Syncephalis plumigaleata]|nr:hypothetical protein BDF22DRAFT_732414 [Syncephalis plumigaleata]